MSPTAEIDSPNTEFMDWPHASHSESFSNLYEEEQRSTENALPLWDFFHEESIAFVRSSQRRKDDISSAVRAARALVELGENWDGEGSQGYSLETWKRVKRFLMSHASAARSLFRVLPAPALNPADQGSLDVFWRLSGRQLLVNFPEDESAPITYYGENRQGNNTISGRTTAGEKRLDLVAWLTQNTE
jgi:hypothetical protein